VAVSSTNRGATRQELDYYRTDPAEIAVFLREWFNDVPSARELLTTGTVLDPCAGGNVKPVQWEYKKGEVATIQPSTMSYPEAIAAVTGNVVVTNDVRPDSPAMMHHDFLTGDLGLSKQPEVIITNPPFSIAQQVIEKSLTMVPVGGLVVMLLRLNFFGSDKRFPFFQGKMPQRAYVHHRRMGFTPDGKTDSIEYMHAVWHRARVPSPATTLRVI
jgi:hypothetical protein